MILKTESSHYFSTLIRSEEKVFEGVARYRFYQIMKTWKIR